MAPHGGSRELHLSSNERRWKESVGLGWHTCLWLPKLSWQKSVSRKNEMSHTYVRQLPWKGRNCALKFYERSTKVEIDLCILHAGHFEIHGNSNSAGEFKAKNGFGAMVKRGKTTRNLPAMLCWSCHVHQSFIVVADPQCGCQQHHSQWTS